MTAGRAVERRIVTVLFADLVGFTSLSERLDAEDVAIVQDAYFDAVRETVARHGGQLEKFVGDAAMAVFGAPRVRDDDADRAVRAGLALVAAVERLAATLGLEPGSLRLRVGVSSGEAVYGEATAERGPVTGDTVNVAARLQAAAEPGSVVVGEITALAVADAAELAPLEPLELKGKAEPVPAWRVVSLYPERSRERALGRLRAPTLGRDEELALLRRRVGETARVVVLAPPGVGKTRLVDELAAASHDEAVLRARLRPDVLAPFEPVGQLLGAATPEEVAALVRVAGTAAARAEVVADLLAAVTEPREAPAAERDQLFAAWLEGLDALAGSRAAVWLVEDVHWASADLLAFLELAGRVTRPAGRLVVATTRPLLAERAAAWVESAERLDLRPLPPAETEALVHALVGDALPGELVERIAERSGGNALFVEELLRMWASSGILAGAGEGWTLAAAADEVPLPPTVQAIYAGQLDDLPGPARTAARRAAVAGRRFPRAALPELDVDDPDGAVECLVRGAHVAGPTEDRLLGASYVYRHALLRDAGYASLARAERARLHVRLADWLAALPEESLAALAEVVARHLAAALENAPALAGDVGGRGRDELESEAADWFERAAAVALGLSAWESARELAARALELTSGEAPLERGRRLRALAAATASAMGIDQAVPLLRAALAAFRAAGGAAGRRGLADAGALLGLLYRSQTRFVAGEELADELLAELGGPDDVPRARLLALRGLAVLNAWDDYDGARADAAAALEIARAEGDAALELEALQLVVQAEVEAGADETERLRELERLARSLGSWEAAAGAVRGRASLVADDDPDGALALLTEAAELTTAHRLVEAGAWNDYLRVEVCLTAGRWDEAIEVATATARLAQERDLLRVFVRTWLALRPIARARDRRDLVEAAFPGFEARRGHEPDSPYGRVVATAAYLTFAEYGLEPPFVPELEPRLASFDLEHGGASWLAALETIVEAWLAAGEPAAAGIAVERIDARLARGRPSRLARAAAALLRSRVLLATGDAPGAAAAARAALGTNAPWWRAKAFRALAAAGDESAAAEAAALERSLGIG